MYVIGLMSGTSADGVDAALVDISGNLDQPQWRLINSASISYPLDLQRKIIDFGQGLPLTSLQWIELSEAITEIHFTAARTCDPKGIAKLVGCHGQTVYHRPPDDYCRGASLQLIQAPLLATLLNSTVVYDFRSKDLAVGGQGAPLSPFSDIALIGRGSGWKGVLNLGGIANLTLIPPLSGPDSHRQASGWDCGPANTLIDLCAQKVTNGQLTCDREGLLASQGIPDVDVINIWLKEKFFLTSPPKSTGRELFGVMDLERRCEEINWTEKNDLVATFTCFTACIIEQELDNLYKRQSIKLNELFVAGEGPRILF